MAKRVGLKYTTYVRAEEKVHINTALLKNIADILEVDVRILLYDKIPEEPTTKPENTSRDNIIMGYKSLNFEITPTEKHLIEILRLFSQENRDKVLCLINSLYKQ